MNTDVPDETHDHQDEPGFPRWLVVLWIAGLSGVVVYILRGFG